MFSFAIQEHLITLMTEAVAVEMYSESVLRNGKAVTKGPSAARRGCRIYGFVKAIARFLSPALYRKGHFRAKKRWRVPFDQLSPGWPARERGRGRSFHFPFRKGPGDAALTRRTLFSSAVDGSLLLRLRQRRRPKRTSGSAGGRRRAPRGG